MHMRLSRSIDDLHDRLDECPVTGSKYASKIVGQLRLFEAPIGKLDLGVSTTYKYSHSARLNLHLSTRHEIAVSH